MSGVKQHVKPGKARFDRIYDRPDPRVYYQALDPLDYQTPHHGARVFSRVVAHQRTQLGRTELMVLDLCCSYGVNAALLNHDVTLASLYARYRSPEVARLSVEELVAADAAFYRARRRSQPVDVVGLDVAESAVAYAERVGLHVAGSSENLERRDPSERLRRILADVDLVLVTGGVGYITARTFERVLACSRPARAPWVAAFALRWVDYRPIAAILAGHGLRTDKLCGRTFTQRRFVDDAERDYALAQLEELGIDTTGKEADGHYHAEFYLSRPYDVAPSLPVEELLAGFVM